MILDFMTTLHAWLTASMVAATAASFLWGVLSIVASPCHLGSIPLIVAFINGRGKAEGNRAFYLSLNFAFGLILTIAIIGLITAGLGRLLGDIGDIGYYIVAIIFFIFGFHLIGVLRLPFLEMTAQPKSTKKGAWAALVLGLVFGLALGPCSFAFLAPVLAVIFQSAHTDLWSNFLLIFAFAIGHGGVIIIAGTFSDRLFRFLNWDAGSKGTLIIRKISGALIILAGIYFIWIKI